MRKFSCVDFVVSGEGEESMVQLAKSTDPGEFESIPGLIYRKPDGEICFNEHGRPLDVNSLPFFQFDSYFEQLARCRKDTALHCEVNMVLPLESSRGCWWGKCNFCNLCLAHRVFRSKTTERVLAEVAFQSAKHEAVGIYFVDEAVNPKKAGELFDAIRDSGLDFAIFLLGRANNLRRQDYRRMYDAGVSTYQVGVEAFSQSLLRKMNKGTRVIQNIEAIKNCVEMGISISYSLMHSFPYQDQTDIEETLHTLDYLEGFPPPVGAFAFELHHGSPVFQDPDRYGIASIFPAEIEQLTFPPSVAPDLAFSYGYTLKDQSGGSQNALAQALEEWSERSRERWDELRGPSLTYYEGGSILTIFDSRQHRRKKFVLSGIEAELYRFCDTARTEGQVLEQFRGTSRERLLGMLKEFDEHRLMYSEEGEYLSLAMKYRPHRTSRPLGKVAVQ